MKTIKAKKIGMTQIWLDDKVTPITKLALEGGTDSLDGFELGARVSISGTSKGKGFQGVVKRHGFHGGPASHGQKDRLRAPGSLGSTAPQRVVKGRKMAGHMGMTRSTIKNLRIAFIDPEARVLGVCGAVPGMRGSIVEIRTAAS